MDDVLVWMIVYNEGRYVRQTIDSILQSSYKNVRILISDNHSTDNTAAEIEGSCTDYPGAIKVISPPSHFSSMAHWDFAWDYVRANTTQPYLVFCGGHDLLEGRYIERLVARAKRNVDVILVSGVGVAIDRDGAVKGVYPNHTPTLIGPSRLFNPLAFITKNQSSVAIHGLMVRRAFSDFKVRYHCPGADILLLSELSIHGDFVCEPDAYFFQRFSEGGASEYMAKHMKITPDNTEASERKVREQYHYIDEICSRATEGMPEEFQASLKVMMCTAWLLKLQYAPLQRGEIGEGVRYLQYFLDSNSNAWCGYSALAGAKPSV
jgi:glycosyltransferase involved in cell wall biosynthesis